MSLELENYANKLKPFLPEKTEGYISELILKHEANFTIARKRKTKLGDYRRPFNGQGHRISVNGDLNQYGFLITTVHEFAHLTTFMNFGPSVKTTWSRMEK